MKNRIIMKNRLSINNIAATLMLIFCFCISNVQAQFTVQPVVGMTAQSLVENVLQGQGVLISNAQFNHAATIQGNNIGIFTNLTLYAANDRLNRPATTYPSGIIMTTGAITTATTGTDATASPSNATTLVGGTYLPDPDLVALASSTVTRLTLLEFDFVANSALVQFNYIFASKEYPQYVNSSFNDIFAFHITGRDPATLVTNMHRNIAIIPTCVPVTINNVNNGPSSSGGSATTLGNNSSHSEYFFDNRSNQYTNSIKYGGFTVDLTASAVILSCFNEPYHMSLSISDVSDGALQSAIFLKAGSFQSPEIQIEQTSELVGNDTVMAGCNAAYIDLKLPQPNTRATTSNVLALGASNGATAFCGTHYRIINMQNGDTLSPSNTLGFAPATISYNSSLCEYVFTGGDTLIRLKIEAIADSILPGEVKIAKIYTSLRVGGGQLHTMCQPPVTTDTITVIFKGYTLLKLSEDTLITVCDQFSGDIAMRVEKGFLQSVWWEDPTHNLHINTADSLQATITSPLYDTTVFTVIVEDKWRCSRDTGHIQINIPDRPVAAIQTNVTIGCSPFKFSPTSISTPDNAYLRWIAPEGQTSTIKNPTFTINADTTIWLYAYAADFCYDSTFVHVDVFERPQADFSYLPFDPLNGRPVEFYNASTGDISDYHWSFGDGTTSMEINPIHTYHVESSEMFNVQLIVTAGAIENCADTTLQQILVEDHYAYYMPSSFTPNGDGVNDVIAPFLADVFDYTFVVYNRWGSLMFFSNEIGSGWDGNDKNGKECEAGVYVWKLNFKKYSDPNLILEYKGTVTLVR